MKNEMAQENLADFATRDLNLAAYLMASDHPFQGTQGTNGKLAFLFGEVSADQVNAYYSGAEISARKLLDALRNLKSILAMAGQR